MSEVTKPIALDESLNTTESTPRNIADVLASGLANIANNVKPDGSDISISVPGMTANNVNDGFSELKGTLDDNLSNSKKIDFKRTAQSVSLSTILLGMGTQIDANRIMVMLPFPFMTTSPTYSVTFSGATILGVATVAAADITLDAKVNTGIRVTIARSGTVRDSYAVEVSLTITY